MKPLRFVFVLSSFQFYGGVLLIIEYANQLTGRGHTVKLFAPQGTVDSKLLARLSPSVRVFESSAPLPKTGSLFALVRLLWSMARELPSADVVVATHTPTVAVVLLAPLLNLTNHVSSLFKRPAYTWLYMDYPEMFRGRYIEQLLLRFGPRWFDAIWVIATPLKEVVSAQTSTPVVITGSGLPNADLPFARQSCLTFAESRRILYVGNSVPRKGLREFLAAMQIVCERRSDSIIVVAGAAECEQLIDQSWIGESTKQVAVELHVRPSDAELCKIYASADLFVSASWGEGLGYPPLEAMACGTPVVLTDSGGVRDYAEHEQNCLIVPPKDVPTMAAAIERVLGDEELARHLSKNGVQTAKRYDWESVGDVVEESAYRLLH